MLYQYIYYLYISLPIFTETEFVQNNGYFPVSLTHYQTEYWQLALYYQLHIYDNPSSIYCYKRESEKLFKGCQLE